MCLPITCTTASNPLKFLTNHISLLEKIRRMSVFPNFSLFTISITSFWTQNRFMEVDIQNYAIILQFCKWSLPILNFSIKNNIFHSTLILNINFLFKRLHSVAFHSSMAPWLNFTKDLKFYSSQTVLSYKAFDCKHGWRSYWTQ